MYRSLRAFNSENSDLALLIKELAKVNVSHGLHYIPENTIIRVRSDLKSVFMCRFGFERFLKK